MAAELEARPPTREDIARVIATAGPSRTPLELAEFSIVARGDTPPAPTERRREYPWKLGSCLFQGGHLWSDKRVGERRHCLHCGQLYDHKNERVENGPRGVTPDPQTADAFDALATEMRANSERWFPGWHAPDAPVPLHIAWALGLAGEVGEVANVVKKLIRDGESDEQRHNLGAELADVFVYLLLLAQECDVDLVSEYRAKVVVNELRWGARAAVGDRPPTESDA